MSPAFSSRWKGRRPGKDAAPDTAPGSVEGVVARYGDLIYDLCESVLWSPSNAQLALRAILKRVKREGHETRFDQHERAWVLGIACEVLQIYAARYGRKLAPSEQIMLDGMLKPDQRLRQLDSYFHRLPTGDQMLLLLRDKHQLPYSEIASALATPAETLKLRRRQALRTLEEWIWNET